MEVDDLANAEPQSGLYSSGRKSPLAYCGIVLVDVRSIRQAEDLPSIVACPTSTFRGDTYLEDWSSD